MEGLEGRHVHGIGVRAVAGRVAARPDIGAGRGEVAFRMIDPLGDIGADRRRIAVVQAFDLVQIEDDVALEEAPAPAGLGLFVPVVGGRDGRGVDDGSALFAFSNAAAERQGLTEGHPDGAGVAAARGPDPEGQDVDAVIGLSVMPQRAGDGALGHPRTAPGSDAGL
ncbi:hypothetical protein D3C71_1089250 [compost metagenome]